MSNEENEDRTVMMTDLPHFLKQMEAEEAAKKADNAEAQTSPTDDPAPSTDDPTPLTDEPTPPTDEPAPSAEEEEEADHTVMMTADMAAQIDASPAPSAPVAVEAPVPAVEVPEEAPAEADEDHTVMMTADMAAQIDATPATAAAVEEKPATAHPDALTEVSPIPTNVARPAPIDPEPAAKPVTAPTPTPEPVAPAKAAPAPAPAPAPAATTPSTPAVKAKKLATPKSGGGTKLITTGAIGAFICFVTFGLYTILPFMQGNPFSGTMRELIFAVGPLGFISLGLAALGFFGAKSRTGAMSLVVGIFTVLMALSFLLLMVAAAAKSKDFFIAIGHMLPLAMSMMMIMLGMWGFVGMKRASKGMGITVGVLGILVGVLVLTFWITMMATAKFDAGGWLFFIRRRGGDLLPILHMAASGLAAFAFVFAGIGLLKSRKL
jgi:hypothetical protein